MKDKSKLLAIILVIITVIVVIVSNLLTKEVDKQDEDIIIVSNYSNFYTVNSCLYRVTTYLSTKDSDSLLLLLDDNYERDNKITKENILEFFPNVQSNSTFISKKMYYQKINSNITKYYVEGTIEINQIMDDTTATISDTESSYFIVYLDSSNRTFSIEPYDGKIFIEGVDNGE